MDVRGWAARIGARGFCFIPSQEAVATVGGVPPDWNAFAHSWNDLPLDTYMADGGRYRRRRYATLAMPAGATVAQRQPHQPHYQSLDYNVLNGGIARHYSPIADEILAGPTLATLLALEAKVLRELAPPTSWHVEVHQFRIEAGQQAGKPTPEGIHRDGVDHVMVMMVKRFNIREGTTSIHSPDGAQQAAFTLTDPWDLTLLDDHRCLHGVTPVVPVDPLLPAYRDVLVVTFRRQG